jgi:hypothetical protein
MKKPPSFEKNRFIGTETLLNIFFYCMLYSDYSVSWKKHFKIKKYQHMVSNVSFYIIGIYIIINSA